MFFRKSKNAAKFGRFTGEATILMADITKVDKLAEQLGPERLVEFLKAHLEKQTAIVTKNGGTVVQFVGGFIHAVWREPGHAGNAVHAAKAMLLAADDRIDYAVAAATESVIGDFFGPIKQYQLLGRAVEQADRLIRFPLRPKRSLLITERTLNLTAIPSNEYTKIGKLKNQRDIFSITA
jgi:class 3 adenylate cyclase